MLSLALLLGGCASGAQRPAAVQWRAVAGYAERLAALDESSREAELPRREAAAAGGDATARLRLALLRDRLGERARALPLAREALPGHDEGFARFILDLLRERADAVIGERRSARANADASRELSELRRALAEERAARESLAEQLDALTAIERSIGQRGKP